MAKYYGVIGFAELVENTPGVWTEEITERYYYGDDIRDTRKLQNSSAGINDNINVANKLSILADPYANEKIFDMRYAEFRGAKWKITDVEVQYPRLVLMLGGLYNG